jgi:transcription antitermination factor NusG
VALDPWFALRVKSNFEQTSARLLHCQGYEEFVPTYSTRRQWTDRTKVVDVPLFPGYIFCRLNRWTLAPILKTPGVVNVVACGSTPTPVGDEEVEAIRTLMVTGTRFEPTSYLTVGQRLEVIRGPLAGLSGILVSVRSGWRIVVSIDLLQRSVAAEIDASCVKAVPMAPGRSRELTPQVRQRLA